MATIFFSLKFSFFSLNKNMMIFFILLKLWKHLKTFLRFAIYKFYEFCVLLAEILLFNLFVTFLTLLILFEYLIFPSTVLFGINYCNLNFFHYLMLCKFLKVFTLTRNPNQLIYTKLSTGRYVESDLYLVKVFIFPFFSRF